MFPTTKKGTTKLKKAKSGNILTGKKEAIQETRSSNAKRKFVKNNKVFFEKIYLTTYWSLPALKRKSFSN